jgi:hypothetical protein
MTEAVLIVIALCTVTVVVVLVMRGRINGIGVGRDGITIDRKPGEATITDSTAQEGSIRASTQGGTSTVRNSNAKRDITAES